MLTSLFTADSTTTTPLLADLVTTASTTTRSPHLDFYRFAFAASPSSATKPDNNQFSPHDNTSQPRLHPCCSASTTMSRSFEVDFDLICHRLRRRGPLAPLVIAEPTGCCLLRDARLNTIRAQVFCLDSKLIPQIGPTKQQPDPTRLHLTQPVPNPLGTDLNPTRDNTVL